MKIRTLILATVISCPLLLSCESWLKVESIGKSTISTFFDDITGLEAAGNGLHNVMRKFYDGYYIFYPDLASDMVDIIPVNINDTRLWIHNFQSEASHNGAYPRSIWTAGYTVVTNANNILYYAPKLYDRYPNEEARKRIDRVFGYAYFARAIVTWDLCQIYGQPYGYTPDNSHLGVPSVTTVHGFEDIIKRNTVGECYVQMEKDFYKALELLGDDFTDDTYINGWACKAILARMYLYMKEYDKALALAEEVKAKFPLTPREQYIDMFRKAYQVRGSESILRMNMYDATSSLKSMTDPTSTPDMIPSSRLISLFTSDDIRLEMMTYVPEECETGYFGKTFTATTKYCAWKSITDERERRADPFVVRCSEMYLISAECKCLGSNPDLAGAVDELKALEARARGKAASEVSLPYTNADSVMKLIEQERLKELNFEGHRLFDLLRWGRGIERPADCYSPTKSVPYGDYRLILPIFSDELLVNEHMVQNEGY